MVESVSLPEDPKGEPSATIEQPVPPGQVARPFLRRYWKAVVATLVLGLLAAAGWALYWFLTADQRLEKSAVKELEEMPEIVLRHNYEFSPWPRRLVENPYRRVTVPCLWRLGDDKWVGEYCKCSGLIKWDYRRTGSKVFPYEATVAFEVRRYSSKHYGSEEAARKTLGLIPADLPKYEKWKDPVLFFEVPTSPDDFRLETRTFPLEPSPDYARRRLPIVSAELLFSTNGDCVGGGGWEVKCTEVFSDWSQYDKWKQNWNQKAVRQTPQ
ncbi:MAG: hypothetical protein WCJ35_03305 [Planctomycetota bacterium]